MEKLLYIPIFLPMLLGVIGYLINNDKFYNIVYINQFILLCININFYFFLKQGDIIYEVVGGWDRLIGIGLKLSELEVIFLLLSVFIFTIILIYIQKKKDQDFKFLFFLLLLQGSFNGLILSDDVFNIFVMLELITITSTILIIYKKDSHSLKAGIYYLLFNSVGMLFYLIGVIILYIKCGTLNLSYIHEIINPSCYDNILRMALIFFVGAFGVKSAIFPVYDWLPKAHSASLTSISALLSGLLVKTGIIGLMKITTTFDCYNYSSLFLYIGIFTAFLGVIFAFSQKDIKQILSFHTVSQIGLIMVAFSINIDIAVLYLINHSVIKTLLFLDAGAIINQYKERRVNKINSLWLNAPLLSIILLIATMALAGLPFTNGFISKATLSSGITDYKLGILIIINAFTFASMFKILNILKGDKKIEILVDTRKYLSMSLLLLVILVTGIIFVDNYHLDNTVLYYLSTKNLVKFVLEFMLGMLIFRRIGLNELKIMKRIRHFSISFNDGIILLVFFILILIYTF
jgi:multicomponent Na+:H+ antiporter subunit D